MKKQTIIIIMLALVAVAKAASCPKNTWTT